ncbi:hypothetical protein D3C81_1231010 [compost metagenome]
MRPFRNKVGAAGQGADDMMKTGVSMSVLAVSLTVFVAIAFIIVEYRDAVISVGANSIEQQNESIENGD